MKNEAYKALDMINAFASVGAHAFDVTFTDLVGKKLDKGGFMSNRSVNQLRHAIGPLLRETTAHQHNLIIRPRGFPGRAELIQLDDLKTEQAHRLEHRAFMTLCTSPGNYQAWVAVSDPEEDFARRLKKGTGADPSASGATRISGSRNFKRKYGPEFPLVEITVSNPGLKLTRAELESAGLVASKEKPSVSPERIEEAKQEIRNRVAAIKNARAWPRYQFCVERAPNVHDAAEDRKDISKADFVFCMTAIDWGHSVKDTAEKLMECSAKARENGQRYANLTAQNAAAAVDRNRRASGR